MTEQHNVYRHGSRFRFSDDRGVGSTERSPTAWPVTYHEQHVNIVIYELNLPLENCPNIYMHNITSTLRPSPLHVECRVYMHW